MGNSPLMVGGWSKSDYSVCPRPILRLKQDWDEYGTGTGWDKNGDGTGMGQGWDRDGTRTGQGRDGELDNNSNAF